LSNVVKAGAADAYRSAIAFDLADVEAQAAALLSRAEGEAAAVIAAARKSAEEIRRTAADGARVEGFEAGRKEGAELGGREGREAAFARAQADIATLSAALCAAAAELSRTKDDLFTQAEMDLLKLSVLIARKIVGREVAADRHVTPDNVKRCLDLLSERRNLVIRVAPSTLDVVNERLPEISKTLGDLSSVKLVADQSLEPGGCLVTSQSGVLDATIEAQFAEVERVLFGDANA